MVRQSYPASLRERIDDAARACWPAFKEQWWEGWLLRFADGYSRRSNSVYPLASAPGELQARVAACEEIFRGEGFTPTFRMTGFQGPAGLDALLAQRHYERIAPTFVLHRRLTDWSPPPIARLMIDEEPIEEWSAAFAALSEMSSNRAATHRAIAAGAPSPRYPAVGRREGRTVACGLSVLTDGFCGIFDVVTAPAERRQGYGSALMLALLSWAQAQGAPDAFLQVVESNRPALRLYEKLGFAVCYEYWYRVLSPVPPSSDSRLPGGLG